MRFVGKGCVSGTGSLNLLRGHRNLGVVDITCHTAPRFSAVRLCWNDPLCRVTLRRGGPSGCRFRSLPNFQVIEMEKAPHLGRFSNFPTHFRPAGVKPMQNKASLATFVVKPRACFRQPCRGTGPSSLSEEALRPPMVSQRMR